jgi:molybdopterin-guanine dinucleotide biosynthesis protein A
MPDGRYSAIVLTGGRSIRFGGGDKTAARVGGTALLDRVLASVRDADAVVVAGPPRAVPGAVTWVREEPAGAGPLAGVAAALPHVGSAVAVVLAGDLPFTAGLAAALLGALGEHSDADAVVPVDGAGRRQPLAAAYRTDALRTAVAALHPVAGRSMRACLERLRVHDVPAAQLPYGSLVDVDTVDDLAAARAEPPGQPPREAAGEAKEDRMDDWLDALTRELGVDLEVDTQLLLDLARDAAHAVSRPAAPLTAFLVGYAAGARGGGAAAVTEAADTARLLAARWTPPPS